MTANARSYTTSVPSYTGDIYSTDGIADPYHHYRALRDLGGAVYMPQYDVWAISRYAGVKRVLGDPATFTSTKGISVSNETNEMLLVGSIITSDGEAHGRLRRIEAEPLMPRSMAALREQIQDEARGLVGRLVAKGSFDAASDLAQYLPLTIVTELVGLPKKGRENMLKWAASMFQLLGPANDLSQGAVGDCEEAYRYVVQVDAAEVRPGSLAARIFALRDQGTIDDREVANMLIDLIGPSLDTTIFGITNMTLLMGRHPEQWQRVRADRSLVQNAVSEVLRLESPIRGFTRVATADADVEGITVPRGARVLVLYASANRDERMWGPTADAFDVGRTDADKHFAFGYGRHSCIGMHLGRLEMTVLLEAMLDAIPAFSVARPEWAMINALRGLDRMTVTLG